MRRASSIMPGDRSAPTTSDSGQSSATTRATLPVPVPRSRTLDGDAVRAPSATRLGEGVDEDRVVAVEGEPDLDTIARHDAERGDVLAPCVRRDVPEPVDDEHGRRDLRAPDHGFRHVEADEARRVDRGA